MPSSPPTVCSTPGCGGRRYAGICDRGCNRSRTGTAKRAPDNRPNFRQRGYDSRWDKARLVWLAEHPICAECERNGLVVAGYAVDHITPHRGDQGLFWDQSNWQTLCRRCHAVKSQAERKC